VLYTTGSGDLAVRRVRSTGSGTEFAVEEVAEGAPFYWDWSPDGQSMFWARFSQQLEIYDVASNAVVETLSEQPGLQRAVDWSPVDNRLLSAIQSGRRSSDLVVFDGDTRQVLVEGLNGIVSFEWSPDGRQVAYTDNDGGQLSIVDARTGGPVAAVSDDVVAFFWSPDGTRIAYITLRYEEDNISAKRAAKPAAQDDLPTARWHVYDRMSGTSTPFAAFVPTRDMLYYLQFYDQFSRSHRLWSPDSRYIVYGEQTSDGRQWVSLLDVLTPGSAPDTLMEGSFGVFSWFAAPLNPASTRG
jgi:TolB protein